MQPGPGRVPSRAVADPDTLQKLGLAGGLLFAVVAGGLYLYATLDSGSEALPAVRSAPPPASASSAPKEAAGTIPVGVLGMMQAPRVVPPTAMEGVDAALGSALGPLGACYDADAASHEPDGTLYVKLHTGPDGVATDIQLAFRGPSGQALHDCASGVLGTVDFGDVPEGTLVSWPVRWSRGQGLRLR